MMLNCSQSDQHTASTVQKKIDDNVLNIIAYLGQANLIYSNGLGSISSVTGSMVSATPKAEIKSGSIFVCTFCQVFAPSDSAIAKHIAKEHKNNLKEGTVPENYVSKLQALKDDKSAKRKVGRPRKNNNYEKNSSAIVKEEESVSNPLIGTDGLYWCKTCPRNFKTLRQINRHVCFQANDQEESLNERDIDDDTADFKNYMDIQPTPWKRVRTRKNFHVGSSQDSTTDNSTNSFDKSDDETQRNGIKVVSDWRDDSSYIPLFNEESEKKAFEKHLNSFDCSFVDNLFTKLEQKSNALKSKRGRKPHHCKYSCDVCEKKFQSLSQIRRHCLIHTDSKPFTCPKCPYRSNVKASIYTHMRSHTGNMFCCTQCNYQSNKRSHLLDHEQTHSTKPVKCKLCKNMYKNIKSLVVHVKKFHPNASGIKYIKSLSPKQSRSITIKCEICDKTFTSLSSLKAHEQDDHADIMPITSSENQAVIKSIFKNRSESATNAEITQKLDSLNNHLINDLQSNFACNICNQNFSSQSLLENHTLLHHCPIITMERIEGLDTFVSYSGFQAHEQSNGTNIPSPNSSENLADVEKIPENRSESATNFMDCSVRLEPLNDQLISYFQYNFACNVCDQKFPSSSLLENHTLLVHPPIVIAERLENLQSREKVHVDTYEATGFNETHPTSLLSECSVRLEPLDDQLVELLLNNILQDKNPPNEALFDDVFQQPSDLLSSPTSISDCLSSNSTPKKMLPNNNINQFNLTENPLLKDCQSKLNIDILDECLRQSNLTNNLISDASYQTSESSLSCDQAQQDPGFALQTIGLSFTNTQLISNAEPDNSMSSILQLDTELTEPESEEIKLFEKCRRAPAYVCCVCSSIFICSSTLKVHLKEHLNKINANNSSIQQPIKECNKIALPGSEEAIDNVCRILQGSSSTDVDNELEKLYTSSLHKMWNCKEFSVVLENDQSLIDAVLDDISNFPITDKYDESQNLQLDSEMFS